MAFNPFRLARTIQQQGLRFLSTRPAEREVVTFMRLNTLTDNPGAVKKVNDIWCAIANNVVVLLVESVYLAPAVSQVCHLGATCWKGCRVIERKDMWSWSQGTESEVRWQHPSVLRRWPNKILQTPAQTRIY